MPRSLSLVALFALLLLAPMVGAQSPGADEPGPYGALAVNKYQLGVRGDDTAKGFRISGVLGGSRATKLPGSQGNCIKPPLDYSGERLTSSRVLRTILRIWNIDPGGDGMPTQDVAELLHRSLQALMIPGWSVPNGTPCWTSSSLLLQVPPWATPTAGPTSNASARPNSTSFARSWTCFPTVSPRMTPSGPRLRSSRSGPIDGLQSNSGSTRLAAAVAGEVVAIDGKTLRGSFDTAAGKNPLHLVSCLGLRRSADAWAAWRSIPNRTKSRRFPCYSNC